MTDVLRLALDRRAELHEEVARIDDFIRMADRLVRRLEPARSAPVEALREPHIAENFAEVAQPVFREQPAAAPVMAPGVTRMNLMRRGGAAAG